MYPTVVMVLVESRRSMMDICELSSSNATAIAGRVASKARPATLRHTSFAFRPIDSTTADNKPESQHPRVSQSWDEEGYELEEAILEAKQSRVSTGG